MTDRMLLTTGPVGREQPLPDDMAFTEIVGESAAGWTHPSTIRRPARVSRTSMVTSTNNHSTTRRDASAQGFSSR